MAGNPLRLDVRLPEFGIGDVVRYQLFRMEGDLPVSTPTFTLERGAGIVVSSPTGGQFSIQMTASHTALWSGKDWHSAHMLDVVGQRVDMFAGIVTSTRSLRF